MTTVRRLTKQAIEYLSQPKKEARDGHSQTPSPLFEGELEESTQAIAGGTHAGAEVQDTSDNQ